MPVFDFSSTPENEKKQDPCAPILCSAPMRMRQSRKADPDSGQQQRKWNHHAIGVFGNQNKRTNFEFRKRAAVPMPIFCRSMQDS